MNFSTFSDETATLAVRQCRFQNQLKISSAKIISFACCLIQFINCVHFKGSCELKVCTTKKPENPSVFLTLPVAHELSVLCMI